MNYPSEYEAKHEIVEYCHKVYARGLVDGNGGNISCRTGENECWITPTQTSKGDVTIDMLIKMDLDGNILNKSDYRPSSEYKVHVMVYKEDPTVMAVIHAHPPIATAYACCNKEIDTRMIPESAFMFGEKLCCAPYGTPGSDELPRNIAPYVHKGSAVLMQNHGALTWGPTLKKAYFNMEAMETYCNVYYHAQQIGGAQNIPHGVEDMVRIHDRKYQKQQ